MAVQPPARGELWRQYEMHVDLYKHYLKLALELNIFYYAVTGAILSFYFSRSDVALLKYTLIFPIVVSLVLTVLCCYGARLNRVTRHDIIQIGQALGLPVYPEVRVLSVYLYMSSALFVIVALGLALLIVYSGRIFAVRAP